MSPVRVIGVVQAYLTAEDDLRVTRAEFERNLAAKARNRLFIARPPADQASAEQPDQPWP